MEEFEWAKPLYTTVNASTSEDNMRERKTLIENRFDGDRMEYHYDKRRSFAENVNVAIVTLNNEEKGTIVVKKAKKNEAGLFAQEVELSLSEKVRHNNIVVFIRALHDVKKSKRYLLMEYCPLGACMSVDLQARRKPRKKSTTTKITRLLGSKAKTEIIYKTFHDPPKRMLGLTEAIKVLKHITEALCFLHDQRVAHLDIKPQNILIKHYGVRGDITAKLTDFGTSVVDQEEVNTQNGTAYFFSPQRNDFFNPFEDDMWCLGSTFYLMCTGKMLFKKGVLGKLDNKFQGKKFENYVIKKVNKKFEEFPDFKDLCALEPKDRLDIHQLKDIIEGYTIERT